MTLGKLLLNATQGSIKQGNVQGVCMICNRETEVGLKIKEVVSGNFTGWSMLQSGDCVCPECAIIFSDQTFRKKSWVVSEKSGFKVFKNDEAAEIMFNPPEPPFFIHIAKQGQKQTWLYCLHRVATSNKRYFFSHEAYNVPIFFEREKAENYLQKAKYALQLGVTKRELIAGEYKMTTWRRAYEQGYNDFLKELSGYKKDLLWEVMVDVARA